jgi:tetratricopeptide (TPR) repeat protein
VALTEFRALRRMTGSPDYLAVLADCERALGRPEAALRLVREGEQSVKDPAMLVELRIVQAGARADSGQQAEALRLLSNEIESPRGVVPKPAQARLRYAYAALLLEQGDRDAAQDWFTASARIDPEGTDALDRLDELNGMVLITDFEDDDEVDQDDEESTPDDGADDEDDAESITQDEPDDPGLPSVEEDSAEVLSEIDAPDEPDGLSTAGSEEPES